MSTSSNRLKRAAALLDGHAELDPPELSDAGSAPELSKPVAGGVTDEEALALRNEKLKEIRRAIDAGASDDEELLEKAMNRMRQAIEDETDSQ